MEPVISRLTYEQHKRLDDAAPDRLPGVLAAWNYLQNSRHVIKAPLIIPAIGLIIIIVGIGLLAWGMR